MSLRQGIRATTPEQLTSILNDYFLEVATRLDGVESSTIRVLPPVTFTAEATVANTFPLNLGPSRGNVSGLWVLKVFMPDKPDVVVTAAMTPHWALDAANNLYLRYLSGLTASEKYSITFGVTYG